MKSKIGKIIVGTILVLAWGAFFIISKKYTLGVVWLVGGTLLFLALFKVATDIDVEDIGKSKKKE